jgi:hypothetical protein
MNNSSDVFEFISRLPLANGVVVIKWEGQECWDIKGDNATVTIMAANVVDVWVDSGRYEDIDKSGDWPFCHPDLETKILDALVHCGLL